VNLRRYVKTSLKTIKRWLDEGDMPQQPPQMPATFDNDYQWMWYAMRKILQDPLCAKRPQYIWGILQGATLGKILGMERVSVIECGVASGAGLLAMERAAEHCEAMIGIGIDVYGFDTGTGLPKPQDYRDVPYKWSEGYYPSDHGELAKRLRRARLNLGFISETVPAFIQERPSPMAFVAIDLCLYSSAKDALRLFDAEHSLMLPRIPTFFRCIAGKDFSEYAGERLAISEFNSAHTTRKLSPMYGLRHFVPPENAWLWPDLFYSFHMFDHPLYSAPDGLKQSVKIDIEGNDIHMPVR
jgi:hypothetical protein